MPLRAFCTIAQIFLVCATRSLLAAIVGNCSWTRPMTTPSGVCSIRQVRSWSLLGSLLRVRLPGAANLHASITGGLADFRKSAAAPCQSGRRPYLGVYAHNSGKETGHDNPQLVFAEPVRTAIGTFGGGLKDVPAPALGAVAIGGAVARAGIRPDQVETVVMGNVVQAGEK